MARATSGHSAERVGVGGKTDSARFLGRNSARFKMGPFREISTAVNSTRIGGVSPNRASAAGKRRREIFSRGSSTFITVHPDARRVANVPQQSRIGRDIRGARASVAKRAAVS